MNAIGVIIGKVADFIGKGVSSVVGGASSPADVASGSSAAQSIIQMISGRPIGALSQSLAKEAKKNIAQFPLLTLNSIPIDTTRKVSKKLENTIAHMIMLCIQNGNDLIDIGNDPNAKSNFLKKFTAGASSTNSGIVDFLGVECSECTGLSNDKIKNAFKASLDIENLPYSSSFEPSLLEETSKKLEVGTVAPVSARHGKMLEPPKTPVEESVGNEAVNNKSNTQQRYWEARRRREEEEAAQRRAEREEERKRSEEEAEANYEYARDEYNLKLRAQKDAKIEKKMDDMPPTIISADIVMKNGAAIGSTKIAMGVKVVVHLFESFDLTNAVKDTFSEASLVVRLVRWRVGELRFIRDVLMNVKQIKGAVRANAGRHNGTGAKAVFSNLRFKMQNAIASNATRMSNGSILPTCILAITKDEVNEIRRACSKDIYNNIRDARELCGKLALFGICIIDPSNDTMDCFFDDGATKYQTYSLKADKDEEKDGVIKTIFGALRR